MNLYEKLQKCRVELQNMGLKKSGKNEYAGYEYYELEDIMPHIDRLFQENKLCGIVSFDKDFAMLTIVNTENPEEREVIKSPMAEANLKGCHAVQNLGAVETYQRRYLYIAAMNITESDPLDATTGKDKEDKHTNKPTKTAQSKGEPKQAKPADISKLATPEQINEISRLAKEKYKDKPDLYTKLLKELYEAGKISNPYPIDKNKRILWTVDDYERVKLDLESPFM